MGYTASVQAVLFGTHCVICGKTLTDAESQQRGMGPECSGQGYLDEGEQKETGRQLIREAANAIREGKIEEVRAKAEELEQLGYTKAAKRIRDNFKNAEKNAKIEITVDGDELYVSTPFRRSRKEEFIAAWRGIEGRRYVRKGNCNAIPVEQKGALWLLLQKFFPGEYGKGPQGVFRIPKD